MKPIRSVLIAALCASVLGMPAMSLANSATVSDATQPSGASQPANAPNEHHHHGMFSMLRTLDLSQQQQDQVKTLMTTYHAAHPKGSPHDPTAKKQLHDQILSILTPAQRTKLEQEMSAWRSQHPEPPESSEPAPAPTP